MQLPDLIPLSSKISTLCFTTPSQSVSSFQDIPLILPKKSEDATSFSYASRTKLLPDSTSFLTPWSTNYSSQRAYLPASSLTVVSKAPLPYSNFMYGSCFPKVSASFKKVASMILIVKVHFLLIILDGSLFTFGGSGSAHIN